METLNIKEEVRSLIDEMPENFTWDDLISAIHIKKIAIIDRERALDRPQDFWEALQKFRQENNLEAEGIEPEVFEGIRDK